MCPSEVEAQCWVRGLRTLKDYVANMTQKEKLDQYPAQFPISQNKYSTAEVVLQRSPTLPSHVPSCDHSIAKVGSND